MCCETALEQVNVPGSYQRPSPTVPAFSPRGAIFHPLLLIRYFLPSARILHVISITRIFIPDPLPALIRRPRLLVCLIFPCLLDRITLLSGKYASTGKELFNDRTYF